MARVGETLWVSDYPGGMRAVRDGIVAEQSLSDEDLSAENHARMTERGERTRLSVPLVYHDEVFGMMILVETEHERRFTPDEVRMAQVIGEQAAASLHNARLHRREEDQHRWLAALAQATRVIGSRLNRIELLRDVAGLATTALLVDRALVYEWDEHDAVFALRAADAGSSPSGTWLTADSRHRRRSDGRPPTRRVRHPAARRRGTCARTAARMAETGEQVVAWVPFRMEDETLGAMRVSQCAKDRPFGEDELSFARALGEHAAIALNNARLYAQIEDLAMKDALTGLANHRRFYDRLAEEIDRGRRCGTSVALLMLDIDDFKQLNDTYGHPAGDEVLRLIGGVMTEECRKGGDLAARYGGEEFCVILPDTSARRAPCGGADDRVLRQAAVTWTGMRTRHRRPRDTVRGRRRWRSGCADASPRADFRDRTRPRRRSCDGEHRHRVVPGNGARHGRAGRMCGRCALRSEAGRQGQGQGVLTRVERLMAQTQMRPLIPRPHRSSHPGSRCGRRYGQAVVEQITSSCAFRLSRPSGSCRQGLREARVYGLDVVSAGPSGASPSRRKNLLV